MSVPTTEQNAVLSQLIAAVDTAREALTAAAVAVEAARARMHESEGLPSHVRAYRAAELTRARAQWDLGAAEQAEVRHRWHVSRRAPRAGSLDASKLRPLGPRP